LAKNKRKNPFEGHQKKKVANREALVRRALELLSGGRFETPNALAKSTAQVVTELERKQAKDGEQPDPMAYTTLIRTGSKYKEILLSHFNGLQAEEKNDVEAELQELRLHCAHVEHENELLRQRLSSMGSSDCLEGHIEGQEGPSTSEDIAILIDMLDGVMGQAKDLFLVVSPNEVTDTNPEPGLYGPYDDFIAEYDALERLSELRNDLK
jgi:hypothetical protein